MTDVDKMTLFEAKGGHFQPSFMAVDYESAAENFINLLQVFKQVKLCFFALRKLFDIFCLQLEESNLQ